LFAYRTTDTASLVRHRRNVQRSPCKVIESVLSVLSVA
jgi:hypothetical protein